MDFNWLAIITGVVMAFLAGWAWYSPWLFGKKWADGSGVALGSADAMPLFAMISQIVALILLALAIDLTAQAEASITALLVILTTATFSVSMGAFVKKTPYALAVDGSYILLAGGILMLTQAVF